MPEEETRDDIIDISNNEEAVKEEPVACVSGAPQEPINVEQPIEEVKQEIKPKAKAKSRAKPKI